MARIRQGVFSWDDVLAQRFQSNKPLPLSRSRRRALPATPQPQSPLLSRLSPELRLMIWEMVVGCMRLHIIQLSGRRLGHTVCPLGLSVASDPKQATCEICHGGGIPQPVKEGEGVRRRGEGMLLGLSLTCRQIYHETIHLVYTLNTFEFSNPWSLPYLYPTIPPELWECIRAVELRWSFPGHWLLSKDPVRAVYVSAGRTQWLETCRALRQIPGLQSFVLTLGSSWFSEPVEKLPIFLDALRGLHVHHRRSGPGVKQGCITDHVSEESRSSSANWSRSTSPASNTHTCAALALGPSRPFALATSKGHSTAAWELRLQGQPYYAQELRRMGDDLRRRGIDCYIRTV